MYMIQSRFIWNGAALFCAYNFWQDNNPASNGKCTLCFQFFCIEINLRICYNEDIPKGRREVFIHVLVPVDL